MIAAVAAETTMRYRNVNSDSFSIQSSNEGKESQDKKSEGLTHYSLWDLKGRLSKGDIVSQVAQLQTLMTMIPVVEGETNLRYRDVNININGT